MLRHTFVTAGLLGVAFAWAAVDAAPPSVPPGQTLAPIPWTLQPPAPPGMPGAGTMLPLQPAAPAPAMVPPPLMYVRFEGPTGSRLTFFRGDVNGETLVLPCVVGVRPGYVVRAALTGIPGKPGVAYYPTLEVRGSMLLNGKLQPRDFPATVVFRDEELERVAKGALVHKAIVLERPERAIPEASTVSNPLEIQVLAGSDLLAEARERGLPLALVHLGQRKFDVDEMRLPSGIAYLPGDKTLPPPAVPPIVEWTCYPLVDPSLRTVHPSEYVSVYDGGDVGVPAGFDSKGKLRGVDPSDTVAQYVDAKGRNKLAVSNRVAFCIPRFVLVKQESSALAWAAYRAPSTATANVPFGVGTAVTRIDEASQRTQLEKAVRELRASGAFNVYGTQAVGVARGTKVKATIAAVASLDGSKIFRSEEEDEPLVIIKWPDRYGVLVGEVITFHLRYTNKGRNPINEVVVIDNLTARFEYLPGTAKTDRDGTFTFQPNPVGSSLLRWEFHGPLLPNESGIISFQVKVR